MSFLDNLIDLDNNSRIVNYIDTENDENNTNKSRSNHDFWCDGKQDSPLFDIQDWLNEYDTEKSGMTKLVSSEEDIISLDGSYSGKCVEETEGESPTEKILLDLKSTYTEKDAEIMEDGFASNDVLTIGDFRIEEEFKTSAEDDREPSMGEHWGNTSYETVLRTNYANIQSNAIVKPVNSSITKNKNHLHSNVKGQLCSICNDIVYSTEKLVVNKSLYHQHCFKCTKCHGRLRMNNFGVISGKPFCMPHYFEVFNQKGRYDNIDLVFLEAKCQHSLEDDIDKDDRYSEMPPPEIIKKRLEIFRQLESNNEVELVKEKKICSIARGNIASLGTQTMTRVSKEDSNHCSSDEMPTPGMTKSLLQHWNSIGSNQRPNIPQAELEIRNIPKMNILNNNSFLNNSNHFPRHNSSSGVTDEYFCSQSSITLYKDIGAYTKLSSPAPFYSSGEPKVKVLDKQKQTSRAHSVNGFSTEIFLQDSQ